MDAYTIVYAKIGTIELDASLSETHSSENEITEFPVDKGAKFSDHIRTKQDKLSLNCLLSNTPVNRVQEKRATEIYDGVVITSNAPVGRPGYAQDAYRKLLDLNSKKTPLTVVTAIRTYQNMAIESISVPRDSKSGDGLIFTMTFKQLVVVQTTFVDTVIAVEKKAHKRVKVGLKVPKADATTKKNAKKQSLADKANSLLGDPLGVN